MKESIIFGKKLILKNEDYYQLLKRFDVKNFHYRPRYEDFGNYEECPLCAKYNMKCELCEIFITFNEIFPDEAFLVCTQLIKNILKVRNKQYALGDYAVSFNNKTGKNQIIRLHKFLLENFKDDKCQV